MASNNRPGLGACFRLLPDMWESYSRIPGRGNNMNFYKMLNAQKVLADRVAKEHPAKPGENRFNEITLALNVEVGECANEWKGFKFWKVDPQPSNKVLEEYVDGVHFILDLALLLNVEMPEWEFPECNWDITKLFLMIYKDVSDLEEFNYRRHSKELIECGFYCLLLNYIRLGAALGFTWDEIEQAYFNKNQVNHERQDNGY
jgi:dimeric dUTPase (all-alpha-NTP-PPase superfamily)